MLVFDLPPSCLLVAWILFILELRWLSLIKKTFSVFWDQNFWSPVADRIKMAAASILSRLCDFLQFFLDILINAPESPPVEGGGGSVDIILTFDTSQRSIHIQITPVFVGLYEM